MDHADHVELLEKGIPDTAGVWADFGSGRGAFTLALADLIAQGAEIYSIDKNETALQHQKRAIQARFPDLTIHYLTRDFTQPVELPPLDGVIMANALHFVRDKDRVVQAIHGYLKPEGRFILVEYNVDRGNIWVPHPLSYQSWQQLAQQNGFRDTQLLATRRSSFLNEFYSALSTK